jgi:hypothetical protein
MVMFELLQVAFQIEANQLLQKDVPADWQGMSETRVGGSEPQVAPWVAQLFPYKRMAPVYLFHALWPTETTILQKMRIFHVGHRLKGDIGDTRIDRNLHVDQMSIWREARTPIWRLKKVKSLLRRKVDQTARKLKHGQNCSTILWTFDVVSSERLYLSKQLRSDRTSSDLTVRLQTSLPCLLSPGQSSIDSQAEQENEQIACMKAAAKQQNLKTYLTELVWRHVLKFKPRGSMKQVFNKFIRLLPIWPD